MLARILSYYQVMPSYLDFLLVFGVHKHSREKRFSGFRQQVLWAKDSNLAIDCLGRSGREFQICYNLKAVAKSTEPGLLTTSDKHWSIRQGAFHHQFDMEKGNSLWIVTRTGLDIKQRIEELTGKSGRSEDRQFQTPAECLRSSLAVHLLLCHWSCENWRSYFQWLEDTMDSEVSEAALQRKIGLTLLRESQTYLVVYSSRSHDGPRQTYSSVHLQRAQYLEEQTNEAVMVLEGNIDVLVSLKTFYADLGLNDQFPLKQDSSNDITSFAKQIESFIYDSKMHIARGHLLAKIIAARKTIVSQAHEESLHEPNDFCVFANE